MHARPFFLAAALLAACGGDGGQPGTPFACGSLTCQPSQICETIVDTLNFVPIMACPGIPSSCLSTPTCDCIESHFADAQLNCDTIESCDDSPPGQVTITCAMN